MEDEEDRCPLPVYASSLHGWSWQHADRAKSKQRDENLRGIPEEK